MAKVDGIVEIQGTVKGMTFYKSKDGLLVRAKGGISKQRMKHDPAFERTRENGSEFGHSAQMGQLVRKASATLLAVAKDNRVSSRLLQRMSQVKNLDFESARGERKVSIGLNSEEGKALLHLFDFNAKAPFNMVFRGTYALDHASGTVSLTAFNPAVHLFLPPGGTHVSLSTAMSVIDLDTGAYQTTYSEVLNVPLVSAQLTHDLTPQSIPEGTGTFFYFLLIEFFQEINGVQYPLKNHAHNMLTLLAVA